MMLMSAWAEGGFAFDPSRINEAAKSVVILEQRDEEGNVTVRASGFAAIKPGLIVTSASFVRTGEAISAVTDDGETLNVRGILGLNTDCDIAILALEDQNQLTPLVIDLEKRLLRGSDCVAVGAQGENISVSIGNIGNLYEEDDLSLIQFTSPLSLGSGGCPLFDEDGNVAGVTIGYYDDRTGSSQNLNFAVSISEALSLYEIVKEDEIAPFSDWAITDVGMKSFDHPELPMEFYIENNTGYTISQIHLSITNALTGKSRMVSELKPGETATIQVSQEEYESSDLYCIIFKILKWPSVHYTSLRYPMSYLLGKTFVLSDISENLGGKKDLAFEAKERYIPQRRHMPEDISVQPEDTIPHNCIKVINDTDMRLLEFCTSHSTSNDLITSSSNMLSGQSAMLFVPEKNLRNIDTFELRIVFSGNGNYYFSWKIKTEDLLGKTMRIYYGEDGEVTYEIY